MLKEMIAAGFGQAEDYNCAEKIFYGANEAYGLGLSEDDLRLAAGFGGGVVGRIKRIEVFAVQLLLCITEHFTKAGRLKQSSPKKSAGSL